MAGKARCCISCLHFGPLRLIASGAFSGGGIRRGAHSVQSIDFEIDRSDLGYQAAGADGVFRQQVDQALRRGGDVSAVPVGHDHARRMVVAGSLTSRSARARRPAWRCSREMKLRQAGLADQAGKHQQHRAFDLHQGPGEAVPIEGLVEPVPGRRAGAAAPTDGLVRSFSRLDFSKIACDSAAATTITSSARYSRRTRLRGNLGRDHQVDVAGAQQRARTSTSATVVREGDAGGLAHRGRGRRGQEKLRGRRHDADLDVPGQAAADVADLAARALDVEARALCPLEEGLAGRGEPDAAPRLLEQGGARRLPPGADAAGRRGLRAVQTFGRAPQVLELGNDFEILKVAQVQDEAPSG